MRIPATRRVISPVWSGLYGLVLIALVCYTTAAPSGLGSRSESIHLASASNPYAHIDEDSSGWRQIVRLATVNPLGEELPHSPGYAYADVDNWTTEEPEVSLPDYHSSGTYIYTQHSPPSESSGHHSHHQQHITNPWAMEGGQTLEEIVRLATVNHSGEELPRTPEYTYPDVDSWTEYDSQAESGHDSSLLYGHPSSASKNKPAQEPSSSAIEASQLLYQSKRTPEGCAMEGWQSPTRLPPSQKQVEQGTSQSDALHYDATSLGHYSDRQLRNLVKWGKPNVGRPPLLISDDERRARKSKQDCEARIRRRERMREGYEERLRKEDEERLRLRTAAGQRQLAAYLNSYKRGRW